MIAARQITVSLVIATDEDIHPELVRDDVAEAVVRAGFDLHSAWAKANGTASRFASFEIGELQCLLAALEMFEHEWVGFRVRLRDEAGEELNRKIDTIVVAEHGGEAT